MKDPEIVILCGGDSGEREVSILSAQPVFESLKKKFVVRLVRLDTNELPKGLRTRKDLIFPIMHGDFGEDGQLQALLEAGAFAYVGSDSQTSRLCMDKMASKALAKVCGIPVLPAVSLKAGQTLNTNIIKHLNSEHFVLKPTDKGSSIGVHLCESWEVLQAAWQTIQEGNWMVEPYTHGRELTVGVLEDKALGVVEIRPKHSFYDFKNKYTAGACDYLFPAPIKPEITHKLQTWTSLFAQKAACLDFARADFIMSKEGQIWFLEMNTIPGMTTCSLLPKSALCEHINFDTLVERIVRSAIQRNRLNGLLD